MDSSNLSKLGFSQWYPFNKQNLKNAPPETGVYVLRKCGGELFGRLNGQSDILYIGSTKKSLKSRLQQYIHPGPTQWTNQRIHKYTKENSVEASWLSCNEPKSLEHDCFTPVDDRHPPNQRHAIILDLLSSSSAFSKSCSHGEVMKSPCRPGGRVPSDRSAYPR